MGTPGSLLGNCYSFRLQSIARQRGQGLPQLHPSLHVSDQAIKTQPYFDIELTKLFQLKSYLTFAIICLASFLSLQNQNLWGPIHSFHQQLLLPHLELFCPPNLPNLISLPPAHQSSGSSIGCKYCLQPNSISHIADHIKRAAVDGSLKIIHLLELVSQPISFPTYFKLDFTCFFCFYFCFLTFPNQLSILLANKAFLKYHLYLSYLCYPCFCSFNR